MEKDLGTTINLVVILSFNRGIGLIHFRDSSPGLIYFCSILRSFSNQRLVSLWLRTEPHGRKQKISFAKTLRLTDVSAQAARLFSVFRRMQTFCYLVAKRKERVKECTN